MLTPLAKLKQEFGFIKGNVLILLLSWIILDLTLPIPETYYPLYVEGLGGTPFILGVIGFGGFIALSLVQLPGGYLADKYGRRWLIVSMTFAIAATMALYAIAPSWHFILAASVAQHLALIYQPALNAIYADSLPPEKRGMGFSITALAHRAVQIPSPIIARFLAAAYGLMNAVRIGYWFGFIALMAVGLLRLRLKETLPATAGSPKGPRTRGPLIELASFYPKALKETFLAWRAMPRALLYLFATFASFSFFLAGIDPFVLLYATHVLRLEKLDWPIIVSVAGAVAIAASVPIGKMIDKMGRRIPLLLAYVLVVPSLLLVLYGDFWRLLIAFSLSAIASTLAYSSYSAMQADLVPREHRGKIMGSVSLAFNVLTGSGLLIMGTLYEYVGPKMPFVVAVSAMVIATIVALVLIKEPKVRQA